MNDAFHCGLMLIGAITFPTIHFFIRHSLTVHFRNSLSLGDIFFICEKCTSSVQAVMSFTTGAIILSEVSNIMTDTHWLTNAYAWFATPYFAYDIWAMYNTYIWNQPGPEIHSLTWGHRLKSFIGSSILMLLHHTVLPLIIFPTIILKLKDTPYYIAAGLMMDLSFFITRILVFPYLYLNYARHANISFASVPFSIPIKCNVGCLLILLPQLYWFWLMCRGTFRVFYKMYGQYNQQKSS